MTEQGPARWADYPECERMSAVADDSHKLGAFLDWLNEQGIHLAKYEDIEGYRDPVLVFHGERYEELLARYFDIDLDKVEREKRAMLDVLRKANS